MNSNKKKIAFVSGGSKGIGLAIVSQMLDENYQIITCGRNIEDWRKALKQNPRLNEVDFIKTDLCDKKQLDDLFESIKNKYGQLDAAVNNAAVQILAKGQFVDIPEKLLRENIESDLLMPTMCIKKELELMPETGGSIVNVTSISGFIPTPDAAMYSAAKYGLEGLTKTLALELIDKNIRLNTVAPGPTMTPRWEKRVTKQDREEVYASVEARSPMKRFGKPEEVANGVLWLLSDKASYIIGHTLIIDGGMSLRGNI